MQNFDRVDNKNTKKGGARIEIGDSEADLGQAEPYFVRI
jgi:hypothetical protein